MTIPLPSRRVPSARAVVASGGTSAVSRDDGGNRIVPGRTCQVCRRSADRNDNGNHESRKRWLEGHGAFPQGPSQRYLNGRRCAITVTCSVRSSGYGLENRAGGLELRQRNVARDSVTVGAFVVRRRRRFADRSELPSGTGYGTGIRSAD